MPITQEYLKQRLDYDPVTGRLAWKRRDDVPVWWNTKYAGKPTGSVDSDGYISTTIDGRGYRVHRLVWLFHYGIWPKHDIDHVNRDRSDNRIENLRKATESQNAANAGLYSTNTSGVKGVSFAKREKKWKAYIRKDGSLINLGYFDSLESAAAARLTAATKLQGDFAREGQSCLR